MHPASLDVGQQDGTFSRKAKSAGDIVVAHVVGLKIRGRVYAIPKYVEHLSTGRLATERTFGDGSLTR